MSVTVTGLDDFNARMNTPLRNRIPPNWLELLILNAEATGYEHLRLDNMCPTELLPLPVLGEDNKVTFVMPNILLQDGQ